MISILDENFSQLNNYLTDNQPSKIFILVDENTHNYCLPTLLANLETEIPFEIIEIEAGEELKTIETATQLWEILSEFSADRKSLLINLGGGVVTDMGGFVASTYKRGIKFINLPTTLLAMCDASIGGKTGIDHQFLKNIVGTFAHPEQIFVFPDFLKTLSFQELRSGFAEMLKHGLIADEKHWQVLSSIQEISVENIAPHIERSMQIKQNVVEKDFKEENIRKTLNFGHTIGHAVESLFLKTGKIVPHGECVAFGMICETELAFLENLIDADTKNTIIKSINDFYPKLDISQFSNEEILSLMINDKKNANGNINFSLITTIGNCNYDYRCNTENVEKSLEFYR
ncbi:MAG: 3-dehydroquinate synthase [Cruoricaptor ignavus]|nr:3-dehydroquinate synthase [Cruoricaptor ignavus]